MTCMNFIPVSWLSFCSTYRIYPCIMRTPILKPVFRKKALQHHSWRKIIFWKNSAEMSNLALPAQKSVTGVDAKHLMSCLFSETSSFMMFSSFSSAVLLLHDWTWSIYTTPVAFLWTRSPGTRLAATWQDSRWRCKEDFSLSNLSTFVQKNKKYVSGSYFYKA